MIEVFLAVLLDWILGDPYSLPHPIRLMGNIISLEEKIARKFCENKPALELAGLIIVIINISLGSLPAFFLFKNIPTKIKFFLSIITYYYCISARMLHFESMKVKEALDISVEAGRDRVKYIVGRDTSQLDEKEIIRATVETVAENTSDGIIAPLFYIMLFGPAGGLTYKFINTMDSMIAYKNEKYLHLGRAAAIVDDLANYIPARLTAVFMVFTSFSYNKIIEVVGIISKFASKHSSPNAGYPESAVAGLLGIQLGGGQFYHGKWVDKATLGYKTREIEKGDIFNTVKIMYKTEILFLIIYLITYLILTVL